MEYIIYRIDEDGIKETALDGLAECGVWFLTGKNLDTGKQECVQVASAKDIKKEISTDLKYLQNEVKPVYVDYYNDFKEYKFSYIDYGDPKMIHLYRKISEEYTDFKFFCVRCADDCKEKLEKFIARMTEATFWRNRGGSFKKPASKAEIIDRKFQCEKEAFFMKDELRKSIGEAVFDYIDELILAVIFSVIDEFIEHPEFARRAEGLNVKDDKEYESDFDVRYTQIFDELKKENTWKK